MNPITKAASEIMFTIPREILAEVFQPKNYRFRDNPVATEEQIINTVIRSRVLVDCNMVGGNEVLISIDGLPSQEVDRFSTVYQIPKDRTQGRTINSVLSLSFISTAAAKQFSQNLMFKPCSITPELIGGQAAMNAMTPQPVPSSAKVELVGENMVLIRELSMLSGIGILRCILDNDENLTNIQQRSIVYFCRLCVLAVKSYIYNQYSITLDKGRVIGGFEIGKFREFVDNWSDAEQQYQEYLTTTWAKVAFINDRESHERLIRMMVGGYR